MRNSFSCPDCEYSFIDNWGDGMEDGKGYHPQLDPISDTRVTLVKGSSIINGLLYSTGGSPLWPIRKCRVLYHVKQKEPFKIEMFYASEVKGVSGSMITLF